jgi:hypothetical protein
VVIEEAAIMEARDRKETETATEVGMVEAE